MNSELQDRGGDTYFIGSASNSLSKDGGVSKRAYSRSLKPRSALSFEVNGIDPLDAVLLVSPSEIPIYGNLPEGLSRFS